MKLDPASLEILWTRMVSMVDESAATLVRASFSSVVRECNDYAVVLLDEQGRLLSQSTFSIPSFICTLPATVRHLLKEYPKEHLKPGDVMITNDPWIGTGHLPDINIAAPIFKDGDIVAFSATVAHVPDIGGRLRSPGIRELFEEGLRLPPLMLARAGRTDPAVERIIRANVRVPDQVMGDIWAQVSANLMLAERLIDLLDETNVDLNDLGKEMQLRSESAMRSAIAEIPDGEYSHTLTVDGFVEPITIRCKTCVRDDHIYLDYTGSSDQLPRAINVVPSYTFAYSAYALKSILSPEIPNNEGSFRPVDVHAPLGSILNPRFPAPVGARAMTGHLLPPAIMGALSQIIPEKVQAAPGSPLWAFHLAGEFQGQPFAFVSFLNGGQGASMHRDGLPAISFPSNLGNTPIEVIESRIPVEVNRKELRRGTGGAGTHKGGDGQTFEFDILGDSPITISFMANRIAYPAQGLLGGESGAAGRVLLNGKPMDPREHSLLNPGDRVTLSTPGGGGFGPPSC
jgi:N-methylhydantoinase B